MEEKLTISDLADRTGVSAHTLRYYETAGLLPEVDRAPSSGHRRYAPWHERWVRFLRKLRSAGMPVRQMREYVTAYLDGEEASWPRRRTILAEHRERVAARIAELEAHLAVLDRKLARGCDPSLEEASSAGAPSRT